MDSKKVKDELVCWLRDWFAKNGPESKAVLGISGGKDSTTVAALLCEAIGKERVVGVLMPNKTQADISDSYQICRELGIEHHVVDISVAFNPLLQEIAKSTDKTGPEDFTKQTLTNLPPRLRMATLYAISQSVNGRVVNTTNYSEKYIGWGTMYGDCAGDVSPLGLLTASEVVLIGSELPISGALVQKAPSDGLTGKTDEDNFGFTYKQLDTYIRTGICEDEAVKAKIESMHRNSEFKRNPMVTFNPGL